MTNNENVQIRKTITELLEEIRYEMSKAPLAKSGYNKHLGFKYFELENFVPLATKLFNERGMCPVFNIKFIDGIEYAVMTIYHGTEQLTFMLPTAEAINSNNPIQNLGSKASYMRRYLYLSVLDLCEHDEIDAADKVEAPVETVKKATAKQISMLRQSYSEEEIGKILSHYNIQSLEELDLKVASKYISDRRQNNE